MKKRKLRVGRLILLIIIFLALAFLLALIAKKIFKKEMINIKTGYVASQTINAPLYDKEYNEVETIIRGTEIKYVDKLIENEYYEDNLDWGGDDAEPDYTSCEIYKAGLQALIVDDFVQSLNPDLQAKIIMDCMVQKTNNNFRRF